MADLGTISLLLAAALAAFSAVGSVAGQALVIPELVVSARRAGYLTPVMLGVATVALVVAFVTRNFKLAYVAEHSNLAMEGWLTWVAFYAGNEGSLLFLALVFTVLSTIALVRAPASVKSSLPYTTAVLMAIALFFVAVMLTMANPFTELEVAPLDGRGINPLLSHPGMFIHPPMLMTGLIGIAIPFAFAMGHLMAGKTGDEWVDVARTWALIIWAVLASGLLLGSWWAYTILGWGGYWAWDPVENAGLLPWLPLTAFVHSIMVQSRRGMFRMWNIALIIFAWGMAMYGMFMNRGGPIPSVHSFAQSTMGWVFLGFLAVNVLVALGLFFWRYPRLRSAAPLDSFLSREVAFLVNNLLLLMVALVVLWGLVFPLLSQAFRGATVTVGAPFYNAVAGPLFLALILLMGVGPLLPWRRGSWTALRRALALPVAVALATAGLLALLGVHQPLPLFSFGLCALVATGILREWVRGTQVRRRRGEGIARAFFGLIAANRPRYGGAIVHLAVVLLAFSITGSAFYGVTRDIALRVGERASVGRYEIEYLGASVVVKSDRIERRATLQVYRDDRSLGTLDAGYSFYPSFSMASSRAGIRSTPVEDLYIIANEFSEDGQSALFRVYVNPLVVWMWIAGPVLILGTVVALWPQRRRLAASPLPERGNPAAVSAGR
jgi:cytochrome c-type biogenesis protein CcmF